MSEAAIHDHIVIDTERKQYRFFQPFVDRPVAHTLLLGHAGLAGIEHAQRLVHRVANCGVRIARVDVGAALEGLFDNTLDVTHCYSPEKKIISTQRSRKEFFGDGSFVSSALQSFNKFANASCGLDAFVQLRHQRHAYPTGSGIAAVGLA